MNLKERARQLKTDIPALFLAFKDKETPVIAKILAGVIAITIKLIPAEVMNRCREDASELAKSNKRWLYALPFLLIWLLILYGILKLIF